MLKKVTIGAAVALIVSLILVIIFREQFSESTFFLLSGMLGLFTIGLVPLAIFLVLGINVLKRRDLEE